MASSTLENLPRDILIMLPEYIHNIEDYTNLSSTCRILRSCMTAATPKDILRLAAAQKDVFFRPSPLFLVMATAKELGNWARISDANEQEFARRCREGNSGLLQLALQHCGLSMERIRELHLARFEIINPVIDIIDQCVGQQWYAIEDFWSGGVSDPCTIDAEPAETFFNLAIYGELFSPDLAALLQQDTQSRRLKVDTRLKFSRYCVSDIAGYGSGGGNSIALSWMIKSSRWRPHWQAMRETAAAPDFQENFPVDWLYHEDHQRVEDPEAALDWRQRLWGNVMLCQGLEGLGMMRPDLRHAWIDRVRMWRDQIARLEKEPELVKVGRQATFEYPFLLGDLNSAHAFAVAERRDRNLTYFVDWSEV
ncbi:uncharacterized protein RCC_12098 [Ramularia collo-cygni]|uniref:Uncharacterized protein n=1 Tax=Ramularia collo-cygni TaxID=112498 RepID=A0A2D3UVN5_9PEZI|nr:uncharacterized protein RCC_12098 [Ramularia collo-cygni]CZT15076.1 uncharacterized protein RCC_12098 [Ramularia collo-cygni]